MAHTRYAEARLSKPNQPAELKRREVKAPHPRTTDHRDSAVLKGLAILAIVLHNFFHFVSPARQNEFLFHPGAFQIFLHEVSQPSHTVQALFSFFGHFGVQVFIFLSAFGLAKSHWYGESSWTQFMWSRIRKLYPTILVIVIPWTLSMLVWMGPHRLMKEIAPQLIAMLLGVSTLTGFGLPPVGPWWFIPFIVQFYALWFLMRGQVWLAGAAGRGRQLHATHRACRSLPRALVYQPIDDADWSNARHLLRHHGRALSRADLSPYCSRGIGSPHSGKHVSPSVSLLTSRRAARVALALHAVPKCPAHIATAGANRRMLYADLPDQRDYQEPARRIRFFTGISALLGLCVSDDLDRHLLSPRAAAATAAAHPGVTGRRGRTDFRSRLISR